MSIIIYLSNHDIPGPHVLSHMSIYQNHVVRQQTLERHRPAFNLPNIYTRTLTESGG